MEELMNLMNLKFSHTPNHSDLKSLLCHTTPNQLWVCEFPWMPRTP